LAPGDSRVRSAHIMVLFDDRRLAEAANVARAIIADDPGHATAHLLLSDALLELGDYPGAIEALEGAMDRHPDLRSYARAGHLRWMHGDVEGAIEALGDAIAAGSRSPEPIAFCYIELATVLWHTGQLDTAERAIERALAIVPGYVRALSLRARILAARGDVATAAETLAEVVSRVPSADDLVRLSELLDALGRSGDARARLAQAEKRAEREPLALALHYARRGRAGARAVALAERAVAERPTVYSHDALALALYRVGRIAAAERAMDRALALGTPDARLHLHRGLIALAAGESAAAAAALDRARTLNPHADPLLAAELASQLGQSLAAGRSDNSITADNEVKAL
ncbi:MAG: tetratricopeptide repeat protein, partial [Myxococcota bacterium]